MKNTTRITNLVKELRLNNLGMIANVLLKASIDVPEYGEEVSSEEQFMSVVREVLVNKCTHYGKNIDPVLSARLQLQSKFALAMISNNGLIVCGPQVA